MVLFVDYLGHLTIDHASLSRRIGGQSLPRKCADRCAHYGFICVCFPSFHHVVHNILIYIYSYNATTYIYTSIYISITTLHAHLHLHLHPHLRLHLHLHLHLYLYTCMYTYMYTCTYIYSCIHIYTSMQHKLLEANRACPCRGTRRRLTKKTPMYTLTLLYFFTHHT